MGTTPGDVENVTRRELVAAAVGVQRPFAPQYGDCQVVMAMDMRSLRLLGVEELKGSVPTHAPGTRP